MKKKSNIIYLVDNYLYLYNCNNSIKYELNSNIIKNGKVANMQLFLDSYKKLIKDNKININLFGGTIAIVINPYYTKADIEVIKNIMENIGYHKIDIIQEIGLYKLNNNNAFLNYNNEYCIISFINNYGKKESYLLENSIFNEKDLLKFIKTKIKKKNLFVFGLNNNIDNFVKKYSSNCYHFNNDETYLFDLIS